MNPLTFIAQCLVLIVLPLLVWLIPCVRRRVPLVPIQIASSFLVGPSLLGKVRPDLFSRLFPAETIPTLNTFAIFAVIIFACITGLHIDLTQISRQACGKRAGEMRGASLFWTISCTSVVLPLLLGMGVAYYGLLGCLSGIQGDNANTFVFISAWGLACGIVALPVLCAILVESGEIKSQSGKFALACAMVHDAFLWIFMTVLLLLLHREGHGHGPLMVFVLTVLYFGVMALVVRPLLGKLEGMESFQSLPPFAQVAVMAGPLFVSAGITEWIGIHYMLGAVMYGAVLPSALKEKMVALMEPFAMALVLPFFLGSAGIRIQFEITDPTVWILFVAMLATTYGGQLIGTILPARLLFKQSWHNVLTLGTYMTSKGILEIVVATILLEAKVISETTFAALLMAAVVLTGLTRYTADLIKRFVPHVSADEPVVMAAPLSNRWKRAPASVATQHL